MPAWSMQRPSATTAVVAGAAALVGVGVGYELWRRRALASSSRGGLRIRVLYGSITGTSEKWARQLARELEAQATELGEFSTKVVVEDLATFSFDALLEKAPAAEAGRGDIVLVLMSTHEDGEAPPNCAHFCTLLEDHVHDFRVCKTALAHLSFAVLGFGSTVYEQAGHYCTIGSRIDTGLAALAGHRLVPLVKVTDTKDVEGQIKPWASKLQVAVRQLATGGRAAVGAPATGCAPPDDEEEDSGSEAESDSTTASEEGAQEKERNASDVEDISESCAGTVASLKDKKPQEMVTKKQRAMLTKEGYKIVGTHSAVKLCRWTKHQLRGRGGCYKHSFYGITSYQCMEATPSLACANKCVFCWRHHKNPTGTEWKWRTDEPDFIVTEGIDKHRQMIKECKGIPGVKKDRFEAAMNVRHCALSLVGEPIMYPRINELVAGLHSRKISTFLVTNAQFPEALRTLLPVTQLYVSVDAGTPEALKAVDRPIFRDFWERYVACLKEMAAKKQRTTYRLTLVKGHNMDDTQDYAKLVALGNPDFIEIKSVTFCGESKASNLTISNTPWHEEVMSFAESVLSHEGLSENYELACEHQHSCIVLIAHKRFKIDGTWNTWIDYERFHELYAQFVEHGTNFDALDYALPTPDWARYGSEERGFDPKETRVFHNRTKRRAKEGLLSEEQLKMYPSNPADAA